MAATRERLLSPIHLLTGLCAATGDENDDDGEGDGAWLCGRLWMGVGVAGGDEVEEVEDGGGSAGSARAELWGQGCQWPRYPLLSLIMWRHHHSWIIITVPADWSSY